MATNPLPYVQVRFRDGRAVGYRGWAVTGDGKRIYSRTFATAHEAYQAALVMRGEAQNRAPAHSLDEACEVLFAELRTKRTKGSLRWYQDHLRAVRKMIPGETDLCLVTPAMLEQFVRDRLQAAPGQRRVKPATVNADLRALHRVFSLAVRRGAVRENPVRQVDRPRADQPAMDWFTDAEFAELVSKVTSERGRDVLLLFALTGVRRSEAARLEPGHVRLNLGQLVVPGKNATRVVPLAPDLDAPLRRLLAQATDVLLPGGTHAIDDLFRAARKDVGDRRLHPHALRHTFGTALVRKGVRPDVVMRLMGHRSITTTQRYVHEVGHDGEQAVRLLRFVPPAGSAPPAQA